MIDNIPENLTLFDDLVSSFNFDKELAYKFFIAFSWFEHVLKVLGYARNRGYVQIEWIRFGEEHDENFKPDKNPALSAAVKYLQVTPPKSQNFNENQAIVWNDANFQGNTELAQILSRVTTVRNNFFHGGKVPEFRKRDIDLLKCCLIILDECVRLNPEIQDIFQHQLRRKGT